jgi:hypothetical protein
MSLATCIRRPAIDAHDGSKVEGRDPLGGTDKVDLRDVLVIETSEGQKLEFEVVGLVEDDDHNAFAIAYSEAGDEFVVTNAFGKLLPDSELAQEILDDFFVLAEESASEET